jgi:hypothetical protein
MARNAIVTLRMSLKSDVGAAFSPDETYELARLGSLERLPHFTLQTHFCCGAAFPGCPARSLKIGNLPAWIVGIILVPLSADFDHLNAPHR